MSMKSFLSFSWHIRLYRLSITPSNGNFSLFFRFSRSYECIECPESSNFVSVKCACLYLAFVCTIKNVALPNHNFAVANSLLIHFCVCTRETKLFLNLFQCLGTKVNVRWSLNDCFWSEIVMTKDNARDREHETSAELTNTRRLELNWRTQLVQTLFNLTIYLYFFFSPNTNDLIWK